MPIEVREAKRADEDVTLAVQRLLPQLSKSASVPSGELVARIVSSDASHLLLAYNGSSIVGMLTLAIFPIPSGLRAWIEDVVVDTSAQGQGVGEALNKHAIYVAQSLGARTIELTSRPSREAANRLYRRLGFEPRETNVYRFTIK